MRNIRHLQFLIPRTPGLEIGFFLTLTGVYVLARICRICQLDKRISTMHALIASSVLFSLMALTGTILGSSNCLVPVLLSFYIFILFLRMKIENEMMTRIIRELSLLMFFVFWLNGTVYFPGMRPEFFSLINATKIFLVHSGCCVQTAYLASAVIVFSVSVLIVSPWVFFRHRMNCVYARIDYIFDASVKMIGARLGGQKSGDKA